MSEAQHPHAAFDEFPRLVEGLIEEFGIEGIAGTVERFVAAEKAEFSWEGRFAEIDLGAWEAFDDEEIGCRLVRILGYFRSRYVVAEVIADDCNQVLRIFGEREFESLDCAENAFLADG